jgi:hypothetical protein
MVEESEMLPSASTGGRREVDVVIHATDGPYPFLIGLEATARRRPADIIWVEQMIAKHDDLPTSQLVLVCESGFTRHARLRAEKSKVATLAPRELDTCDPKQAVLAQLATLWPKFVTLTAESAQLLLRDVAGETRAINNLNLDAEMYGQRGEAITLGEFVVERARMGHFSELVETMRRLDHAAQLTFYARDSLPPKVRLGGVERPLCFRNGPASEEWIVETTAVGGVATVEIGEIPLTHRRLGEINFSYGTGQVGDRELMAVINNGIITLRPAPPPAS